MTDIHALLARAAELDSAATDGPWHKTQEGLSHPNGYEVNGPDGSGDYVTADCCGYQGSVEKSANADLIAEYRTLAPAMARALEAVLELLDEMQKFRNETVENYDVAEWHVAQRIRTAITEHLGAEDA